MKIIYLHQYFNTLEMSGSTRSYEMARRLVKMGHEVHMVTTDRDNMFKGGGGWKQTVEDGINVHWINLPYRNQMNYRERIKAFLKFSYLSSGRAAALKGDVIFATSTPLTIALPAIYAKKKNKIPMVFEVRDLWPEVPIVLGAIRGLIPKLAAQYLEHYAYANATKIVALSPRIKQWIINKGYPESDITVIPNASDLELFSAEKQNGLRIRHQYDWLKDRPLVVYTGTIGLVNYVEYIVFLASHMKSIDPEIRFLIIGDGKEKEKVRRIAQELGVLDNNFFMLPPVPKKEVAGWLAASSMAVSVVQDIEILWADSANKFFDALAAGKPIAINYGGWQADIIKENDAGLVLDPKDTYQSAKILAHKLRDEKWLTRAGHAAFKLAVKRFDRDKLALELEKVLISALNK